MQFSHQEAVPKNLPKSTQVNLAFYSYFNTCCLCRLT